jgi:hypothetical protein
MGMIEKICQQSVAYRGDELIITFFIQWAGKCEVMPLAIFTKTAFLM